MSSRNYKKGAATLTIVIFDYGKDNDVLKKYTDSWASPSPENATQAASVEEFPAWQSVSTTKDVAELYVNVKDRYLLYLSTKGSSVTFLKAVVKELKPRQLPQ
jgi:hypothetical protein